MPEIFDDIPADEFALPGDEQILARIGAAAAETAPPPAAPEPAAAAETNEEPAATEAAAAAAAEVAEPETPAEPEEPAAASEPEVDDPEVQAYLEKFGGDASKALKAAVHAQELIGRQGQKLGELQKLIEDRLPEREPEPQPQYDQDALEVWFAEHPTQIPEVAANAYYACNEQVMNAALAAWEEVDRGAARTFERRIAVLEARRELSAETEQRVQVVDEWNGAAAKFAETHPDLDKVAPAMRELAPQFPNMLQILRTGDPDSKLEVLEFLYEKARGHNSDTLATTARTIAREQAEEAEAAIAKATVASTTTVAAGPEPSTAERIAAEWDNADAPYRDAWKV